MYRRTIAIAFLVVALVLSLGGATQSPVGATSKPYAGQTITVLMEQHPSTDAIQKQLGSFENATGIKVNLNPVPFDGMRQVSELVVVKSLLAGYPSSFIAAH